VPAQGGPYRAVFIPARGVLRWAITGFKIHLKPSAAKDMDRLRKANRSTLPSSKIMPILILTKERNGILKERL
jgi:hypothetical protein